jgi:endonuclease V-like protein UPF0215 family
LLKREIRILGLSGAPIGHKVIIASVVFRGYLWLDGVATTMIETKARNYNLIISNLIKNSKQYSQLHAIIISQRLTITRATSIQDLARSVKLPVIAITDSHLRGGREKRRSNKFTVTVSGERVRVAIAGVERKQAEMLYEASCGPACKVPEAVRIADLLANELSRTLR